MNSMLTRCCFLLALAASMTGAHAAPADSKAGPAVPGAQARVLGQTERLFVVEPAAGDSLSALAERFLGDAGLAWQLAEANGLTLPKPGQLLVVPKVAMNPRGFLPDKYQTIPVLSYPRFGSVASVSVVTPEQFESQLKWLADEDVRVVPLSSLVDFLGGRAALPARSVVITVDDADEAFFRLAWPLLKRFNVPATLFLASDFVGSRGGLGWEQLREMAASGLVSLQSHGKTHRNLAARAPGESERSYRRRLETEIQAPRKLFEQRLASAGVRVSQFAFPDGDANQALLETLERNAFDLGLGMQPGANPSFAHPHWLKRTRIGGVQDLAVFRARLGWHEAMPQ